MKIKNFFDFRSSNRRYAVEPFQPCYFIKKRFQRRCLPVKFAKSLKTPTLMKISEQSIASLIWNMTYKFSITLTFSSTLRNFNANSEVSLHASLCEVSCNNDSNNESSSECILEEILCILSNYGWNHGSS